MTKPWYLVVSFFSAFSILAMTSGCSQEDESSADAGKESVQAQAEAPTPVVDEAVDTAEAKIERAMSAGPPQISKDAMIMDVDGSTLREGSNGWICMPSMSPNDKIPMCNDATWMALLQAFMKKEPYKAEKVGISYMLGGDIPTNNDDPYDTTRDEGEPWVEEGPHIMIVFPDKADLEGWPDDPNAGGPYVMWKNTPYAHIMIPIEDR